MQPQIIKPQGRPVRRILIEVDAKGQAQVEAQNFDIPERALPLHPLEVALILSQVLATTVVSAAAQQMRNNAPKETKATGNNGQV